MNILWRLVYWTYRLVSRIRYSGIRRFTRPGWMVACGMIVAALMGPDTENNVAYQGFTLLFFLLAVAVVFSWFFRVRFSAVRQLPRFGSVGCPMAYTVVLRNQTRRVQTGLTLLEDLADPRPSFQQWRSLQIAQEKRVRSFSVVQRRSKHAFKLAELKEAIVPSIPSGQESSVRLELTPLRRGLMRFAGVTVARADPLGLFRAFSKVPLPQSALILPKRYPLPPVALPGCLKYQEGGVALASNVGQSDEFVALRDYRHGDPVRHIHWRSWAKTGKPVVKEFEDEFFVRHALVLDTFTDHPHNELFEEAVSVAASFACTLLTQESLLDLLFVGPESYCFTSGRGVAQSDRMLEVLASVQPCLDKPFETLERLVLNHARIVSGCICVLLAWDESRRNFIERLITLGVPVLVLVMTQPGRGLELDPGPAGRDCFYALEAGDIERGLANLR